MVGCNRVECPLAMSQYPGGVPPLPLYNPVFILQSSMFATSALLFGLFGLYDGQRSMKDDNGKSTATYYVVYNTSLTCADDPEDNGVDANLRVFCPQGTALFADGTVVYGYTKMFVPPKGPVQLDAIAIHPFPGDPSSDEYDDHVPRAVPSVVVLYGSVTGAPSTGADGSRTFPLTVSDYVRDTIRQSQLQ